MTDTKEMRAAYLKWWDEFKSAHEDWPYADSEALRLAAFQAAWARKPAEQVAGADVARKLAKWITQHPSSLNKDHACSRCHPFSDLLKEGFVCAFHTAVDIMSHPAPEPVSVPVKWEDRSWSHHPSLMLEEHLELILAELADWRALAAERGG